MTWWLRPHWLILAAILLLDANCAGAPVPARAPDEAGPLRPLYEALDALEIKSRTRVAILQIGDSHTANDAFSGRMRELFQARFGDAGRGMLPPGIPFKFYRPAQVVVTASNWQTIGSLTPASPGPFGIAGVREAAQGPAEMTLQANSSPSLGRVVVEALGQQGGGTLDASFGGGRSVSLSTSAKPGEALWLALPEAPSGATLTVRARGDGPVDLLSWSTTLDVRGVTYSNLGTIGATVGLIGRWDPVLVKSEMARLHPVLILVAFGTNEGFQDTTDIHAYRALYADRVASLHAAAPWAAILVMGPPDGSRAANHAGATGEACPPPTDGPSEHEVWMVPPRLAEVREAQREVARDAGYYFWDWSKAMGGPCSMQAWARTSPPMGNADHVHLLTPGYRATAELLFQEIMRGYAQYRDLMHPR